MKKRKSVRIGLLVLTLTAALGVSALAAGGETIRGTVEWDGGAAETRPESLVVRLEENGREIAATSVSAGEEWTYAFPVDVRLPVPDYTVTAETPEGYEEDIDRHVDPALRFVCPVGETWTKYEPCNALAIDGNQLMHGIIAGKMTAHRPFVIWSSEPLNAWEREIVLDSLKVQSGVGNPSEVVYISGEGENVYGMKVSYTEGQVVFDAPSDWSLLFGGEYERGETEALTGKIVFRALSVVTPTPTPTAEPTPEPTPTAEPTPAPTAAPSATPTAAPTSAPTAKPDAVSTSAPKDNQPKTGLPDAVRAWTVVLTAALVLGGAAGLALLLRKEK